MRPQTNARLITPTHPPQLRGEVALKQNLKRDGCRKTLISEDICRNWLPFTVDLHRATAMNIERISERPSVTSDVPVHTVASCILFSPSQPHS